MKRLLTICAVMGTILSFGNATAALVDLSILPASSTVGVGDTIYLELWATSSSTEDIGGIHLPISWTLGELQYVGYIDEIGGLWLDFEIGPFPGQTTIDGSMLGTTVPTDVLVYTLQFQALAVASSTSVDIVSAIVRDGGNATITGTLSSAAITIIPEPSAALLLAGGLAGLAAAGRRRSLH